MKNKQTASIEQASIEIIRKYKPAIIECDLGSEFISKSFKDLLKLNNIEIRYVDVQDHTMLGIIDRFCRTLRSLKNKYSTAYKTTRYIDVLDKLVDNYNNTYHSGIKTTPNKAKYEETRINEMNMLKYMKAKQEESTFDIGDKVRYIINLSSFEKKSLPKWSKSLHTIVSKNQHSYVLDNGNVYKPYLLQKVVENISLEKKGRPATSIEYIKKKNTVKRRLHKEDISLKNIIDKPRSRTKTDVLNISKF